MTDHTRTRPIHASPDALFAFLSRIEELPRYIPDMTRAEPGSEPGELHVAAMVHGHEVEGTARVEVDETDRRLTWSSEGDNDYHGWLHVAEAPEGSSVEVHISTERVADQGAIDQGLERVLDSIQQLIEGSEASATIPPAHDDFPTGTLVAVALDAQAAAEVVDSAREAGATEAHLLASDTVLQQDAERRERQGPLAALFQTLGSLVSDQRPIQDRYLEHARAGHPMVVVSAPDEDTAEAFWQVMRQHGAHDGTWYGSRVVREMQ